MDASRSLTCAHCGNYLFNKPRQAPCGDRLCGDCFDGYQCRKRPEVEIKCPLCSTEFELDKCFRDKAVELELASSELRCPNRDCPWKGESRYYNDHLETCTYSVIECPNSGCSEKLLKTEVQYHVASCKFAPITCQWCAKQVPAHNIDYHFSGECSKVPVACPNECGESLPRELLQTHIRSTCPQQIKDCEFSKLGCKFTGKSKELSTHEKESTAYHMKLLAQSKEDMQVEEHEAFAQKVDDKLSDMDRQLAVLKRDLSQVKSEISLRLQPLMDSMVKVESSIQQLQEGFGEMALIVQTLQATSYNGCFVWKIPDVARRRREAKLGKVISLYSAPFYTSRHGYKMCLRLYMDGDGGGKGSHLSFFLTLMKGEYDALLPWPFRQTVSLQLLDQDRQKDIVQSFRPDPVSSSFQRPRNEMNVASGCPLFAPLSVLDNPSYVKDDTLFMKCKIDISGLETLQATSNNSCMIPDVVVRRREESSIQQLERELPPSQAHRPQETHSSVAEGQATTSFGKCFFTFLHSGVSSQGESLVSEAKAYGTGSRQETQDHSVHGDQPSIKQHCTGLVSSSLSDDALTQNVENLTQTEKAVYESNLEEESDSAPSQPVLESHGQNQLVADALTTAPSPQTGNTSSLEFLDCEAEAEAADCTQVNYHPFVAPYP